MASTSAIRFACKHAVIGDEGVVVFIVLDVASSISTSGEGETSDDEDSGAEDEDEDMEEDSDEGKKPSIGCGRVGDPSLSEKLSLTVFTALDTLIE
jgi:hypothetical protein